MGGSRTPLSVGGNFGVLKILIIEPLVVDIVTR